MVQGRQLTLDVVRGTAILLVLLFHFRMPLGVPALDAMLQPVFAVGWIGVDLFFVLSGFLVGRIILAEAATPAGLDRSRFFVRRAVRLWPVLFFYLLILWMLGGGRSWPMIWPVLLHVQNYDAAAPSHLWSLAVEEHFYLAAMLVIPPLLRRGGHRYVEQFLVAVMLGCLALRLAALAIHEPLLHLQWQTQYRLDSLAFGVLMASTALHRPEVFARFAAKRRLCMAIAMGGVVFLSVAGNGALRHGIGFTIAYLASGAFIMALVDCPIAPALAWPARRLAAIGLIAYPLYIWHASIGAMVRTSAASAGIISPPVVVGGSIAASVAIAVAMHVLIERPAMRRRNGRRTGPRSIEATPSPVT